MPAGFQGTEYTVTGTASSLTSALGGQVYGSDVVFRASRANVGTVFIGKANVTVGANRLAYIDPGEGFSISLAMARVDSGQIFIVGTPGDVLHISVLS